MESHNFADSNLCLSDHADKYYYGVVHQFVGHGVGRVFHADPVILHFSKLQHYFFFLAVHLFYFCLGSALYIIIFTSQHIDFFLRFTFGMFTSFFFFGFFWFKSMFINYSGTFLDNLMLLEPIQIRGINGQAGWAFCKKLAQPELLGPERPGPKRA